jgi:hypothetical protein
MMMFGKPEEGGAAVNVAKRGPPVYQTLVVEMSQPFG